MSTFNKIKDRDAAGKPLPHFRIKYPSTWGIQYVHHRDRRGPNSPDIDYNKNPGWWNRLYTTKRRRADDRANIGRVMHDWDTDGLVWLRDKRPSDYYW